MQNLHLETEYTPERISQLFPKCKPKSPTASGITPSGTPETIITTPKTGTTSVGAVTPTNGYSSTQYMTDSDVPIANRPVVSDIYKKKYDRHAGFNGSVSRMAEDTCSQTSSYEEDDNDDNEDDDDSTDASKGKYSRHLPPPRSLPIQSVMHHLTPALHHKKKSPKSVSQYKLRDSRVIEIAGGREVFSQSRSKAFRKSRSMDNEKSKPGRVWELRAKMSDDKGSDDNREITETVFSSEIKSVKHQHVQLSPGFAGSVVFDDIGDEWEDKEAPKLNKIGQKNNISRTASKESKFISSESNTDSSALMSTDSDSTAKNKNRPHIIGGIPIAEYEGSPRRYGQRQTENMMPRLLASPTMNDTTPQPGFPQRVVAVAALDMSPSSQTITTRVSPSVVTGTSVKQSTGSADSEFNYLYEYSETRKVLEEFFKGVEPERKTSQNFQELQYDLKRRSGSYDTGSSYVGLKLAEALPESSVVSPSKQNQDLSDTSVTQSLDLSTEFHFPPTNIKTISSRYSPSPQPEKKYISAATQYFTYSPDSTDCESNLDDADTDPPVTATSKPESGIHSEFQGQMRDRLYPRMPVLEDGLSSGHNSDNETNNQTIMLMKKQITEIEKEIIERGRPIVTISQQSSTSQMNNFASNSSTTAMGSSSDKVVSESESADIDLKSLDPLGCIADRGTPPPPPAPVPHREVKSCLPGGPVPVSSTTAGVDAAIKDIRMTLQRTKTLPARSSYATNGDEDRDSASSNKSDTPVWILRKKSPGSGQSGDEDDHDTDLETDRLLGQQRTEDQGFFDDNTAWKKKPRSLLPFGFGGQINTLSTNTTTTVTSQPLKKHSNVMGVGGTLTINATSNSSPPSSPDTREQFDDTSPKKEMEKKKGRSKEDFLNNPSVLIEGVLFRAKYLGSTQLTCEGQPTKATRMMQAEEAVSRIKAPDGESQPSTEVDLFISTEKIMVLNTDLKEIMMDHALRTISYIADIGDLVVLMARRRVVPHSVEEQNNPANRTPKMICHVFESEEAQYIAQSIGQAFQVAYMEFLKANGIEDHAFVKEMDYQEVLNSQEIFGDEIQMFAKKELQKEVVVPKIKGEILGVVIVESGWGSMLPTVVIANLAPSGAAARCGQLNIGDQIIAVNGISLVGLPLSTCQNYIKNSRTHNVVKLTVVPCPPVVEVKIKRPDTKYQLGFSVQNGVICSLLRGGIAERGGVRVGHRIIEINNQSVVAVPHERIVTLLATSVGEILMKTMPTSMFRLLTGQETPVFI